MADDTTPADPEMTPEEVVAHAIWHEEAVRAATLAIVARRTPQAFRECSEGERRKYLRMADAAIRALPLSTPVVAHQGAESDRQRGLVGALEGATNWLDALLTLIDETDCNPDDGDRFDDVMLGARLWLQNGLAALSPTPGEETQEIARWFRLSGASNYVGQMQHGLIVDGVNYLHSDCLPSAETPRDATNPFAPMEKPGWTETPQPPAETDAAAIRAAALVAEMPDAEAYGDKGRNWTRAPSQSEVEGAILALIPQPTPEPQGWRPLTDMPEDGIWAVLYPGFYGPFTACAIFGKWTMCDDGDLNLATMWRPCPFPAAPMTGEEEIRE